MRNFAEMNEELNRLRELQPFRVMRKITVLCKVLTGCLRIKNCNI